MLKAFQLIMFSRNGLQNISAFYLTTKRLLSECGKNVNFAFKKFCHKLPQTSSIPFLDKTFSIYLLLAVHFFVEWGKLKICY